MDRLKKEWRETQIPEQIRLRAKNRAWEKLNRPVFRKRTGTLAFAVCVITLVMVLVRFSSVPEEQEQLRITDYELRDDVPRPMAQTAPEIADARNNNEEVTVSPTRKTVPDKTVPIEIASNETVSREADHEPQRVVLNFMLPESGARLIWIMQ